MKPFVLNPPQDMSVFSKPLKSYEIWNERYKHFSREEKIPDFLIFSFMGIARRVLLLSNNNAYKPLTDHQLSGMISLLLVVLRATNQIEQDIIARELLNVGRSLKNRGLSYILELLEKSYKHQTNAHLQRNLQEYALLLISGYDRSLIKLTEWYLQGISVSDRDALFQKINNYADRFLPLIPSAAGGAGAGAGVSGGAASADEDVKMGPG